jgi:hypothetical protein
LIDRLTTLDRQGGRSIDDARQFRAQPADGLGCFIDDHAQVVLRDCLQRCVSCVEQTPDVGRNLHLADRYHIAVA